MSEADCGQGVAALSRAYFTLLGLGERCAAVFANAVFGNAVFGDVETDMVKPYLVGTRDLLDDDGHAARAYGTDALILVRPDGYIGLIADPAETETVAEYLRSLQQAPAATRS